MLTWQDPTQGGSQGVVHLGRLQAWTVMADMGSFVYVQHMQDIESSLTNTRAIVERICLFLPAVCCRYHVNYNNGSAIYFNHGGDHVFPALCWNDGWN